MSEEQERQYREYLAQVRSAPAEQILTELLSGLLSAAQAKLGRRDARLLIDVGALVLDHARGYLSADLGTQVDQLLGQLRLGQVQAEQAAAQTQAGPGGGAPAESGAEPNDLPETPAPPAAGGGGSARPAQPPPEPSPTSRLWVPGR